MTTYLDKVSESHLYKTVLDDHFLLYEDGSAPVGERSTATFVKLCGGLSATSLRILARRRRVSWRLHEWYGGDGRLNSIRRRRTETGPSAWWDYDRLREFTGPGL